MNKRRIGSMALLGVATVAAMAAAMPSAAYADTTSNVSVSAACGPLGLTETVTANVTGAAANVTYTETVTVGLLQVSTTFTTDSTGVGVGSVTVPLSGLVGNVLPVAITTGGQTIDTSVTATCSGLL